MSKSAKAKVDEQLAGESHQLQEQKIHKTHAVMEVQVNWAEKVRTKQKQGQLCLNRAWQVATIWSDAEWQSAIKHFECEIQQVTPVKCKFSDTLFQHHERQLFQELGTIATGPRSIFPNWVAQRKTAAEELVRSVANMMADVGVKYQVHLCDAETEATTGSDAITDRVVTQLETWICGIALNKQMRFKTELCICLIEFDAWWKAIGIQELR